MIGIKRRTTVGVVRTCRPTLRAALGIAFAAAILCGVPGATFPAAPPRAYVDSKYEFAFQYPADWKAQKVPPPDESGEVRVFLKHPSKPIFLVASVGGLGYRLTRKQYLEHKDRAKLENSLLEWTIARLYQKTSTGLGATRMDVAERQFSHSDLGLFFYISTGNLIDESTVAIAGQHVIPFGKGYVVNFLLVSPVESTDEQENEILTNVFNSFHMTAQAQAR